MKKSFKEWRDKGLHLPKFMRDFHDQKDLFKSMHEIITDADSEEKYSRPISWIDGHIYVIDIFLWFMARYGYTLQKTRTRINFRDIRDDIESSRKRRVDVFSSVINSINQQ